ncbi:DUF6271 family protein [Paraglaciecola sp.]|uniref:DUF6271 family protein n=1 Tax=Paraglaciecola sp. TaxID=1920173 RepID=UPI0030F3925F
MNKICLALPTNRECADTIRLLHQEARYAAEEYNISVCLLIIDTSSEADTATNLIAVNELDTIFNVEVKHVDNKQQKQYFNTLFAALALVEQTKLLDLMLPQGVSYGACTNRAFLLAATLGCDSVHRRDSDCHYQVVNEQIIFPIHQELLSLGKTANSVNDASITKQLSTSQQSLPVAMVAASFIGEMSVDINEIKQLNPAIYSDIVSLWAEQGSSKKQQDLLVEQSFKGAENSVFTTDQARLGQVDPMLVDMCNISFFGIHQAVPLPPAKDTIGSDYFLIHLVYHAQLPSVVHNRHIENYYTPERRTDDGFIKYQRRFVKFLLSMPYFHNAYQLMSQAGTEKLLNDNNTLDNAQVCHLIESTLALNNEHCHYVFDEIIKNYQLLAGRYQQLADILSQEKEALINQAQSDMKDYYYLAKLWPQLINLAKQLTLEV